MLVLTKKRLADVRAATVSTANAFDVVNERIIMNREERVDSTYTEFSAVEDRVADDQWRIVGGLKSGPLLARDRLDESNSRLGRAQDFRTRSSKRRDLNSRVHFDDGARQAIDARVELLTNRDSGPLAIWHTHGWKMHWADDFAICGSRKESGCVRFLSRVPHCRRSGRHPVMRVERDC